MPDEKTPGRYPTPRSMEAPTHPTQQIPRVQVSSTQMDELIAISKANAETLGIVKIGVVDLTTRMDQMEEWRDDVEARLKRNSARATQTSEADLAQDAAIAAAATRQLDLERNAESAVARLAKVEGVVARIEAKTDQQTALLERLDKVAANPLVRKIAYGLAMLLLSYLAARGFKP